MHKKVQGRILEFFKTVLLNLLLSGLLKWCESTPAGEEKVWRVDKGVAAATVNVFAH